MNFTPFPYQCSYDYPLWFGPAIDQMPIVTKSMHAHHTHRPSPNVDVSVSLLEAINDGSKDGSSTERSVNPARLPTGSKARREEISI
jgi:hypothetical protein